PRRPADSHRDLVANLRRLASEAGPDTTAFVAGIPVEKVDVASYIARDQKIFVPLVFLILAVMTAVLYRHPIGMLVPLAVLTLAPGWALGLFGLMGRSLNPVTSLMTPVILVMSLEAAIQLLNQYLAARARGPTIPPALGLVTGCAAATVAAPLGLASLPDFPPRVVRAFEPGPVERGLSRVVRWVCEHPSATGLGVVAILVLSAVGVARIRVETDLIRSLRHAS